MNLYRKDILETVHDFLTTSHDFLTSYMSFSLDNTHESMIKWNDYEIIL